MKNGWASIHSPTRPRTSKENMTSTILKILDPHPSKARMKWTFSKINITYLTRKSIRGKMLVTFKTLRLSSENVLVKNNKITNSDNYKRSLDLTVFSTNSSMRAKSARMTIFKI